MWILLFERGNFHGSKLILQASTLAQLFSRETTSPQQMRSWLEDPKVVTQAQMQHLASDVTVVAYFCNYGYNFLGANQTWNFAIFALGR